MRVCEQCGADLGPPDPHLPKSTRAWCSSACADKAIANEPGWVRVEDMTSAQRAELDRILAPPSDIPSPEIAAVLLDKLRPSLDKARWDEFGDRVWLKPCFDENGKRSGITQCCLVEAPCPAHVGWIDEAS